MTTKIRQPLQGGKIGFSGRLQARVECPWEQRHDVTIEGVEGFKVGRVGDLAVMRFERFNAFVGLGMDIALDRLMGTNGPPGAISHMMVTDDTGAVTLATDEMNPSGGNENEAIVAVANKVAAASQTVSADGTFTDANSNWAHQKVGFLNTSADDGSGLINIIGGTGGSSPYDEPFTVDLSSADSFSVTYTLSLSATAV